VNIALLLFMFISPIGFTVDSVPARVRGLVYLNPLTYLIESFRYALIGVRVSPVWTDAAFFVAALLLALAAATFFRRMSPVFSDYE
jgi:lipopolysaccharide transport system permease protein